MRLKDLIACSRSFTRAKKRSWHKKQPQRWIRITLIW